MRGGGYGMCVCGGGGGGEEEEGAKNRSALDNPFFMVFDG